MCEKTRFSCIEGFGEELNEIVYEGLSNWLISFRSPSILYQAHFSYLVAFIAVIACGILSLKHAQTNGERYLQLWFGAFIHGLMMEVKPNKYWYAQAPIMFFAKRIPLHVLFLYPSIIYLASMGVEKLKLTIHAEPCAVGLLTMLMQAPFLMISARFLHVTYHDTEPTYNDKIFSVPWSEMFSVITSTSSFIGVFHNIKVYLKTEDDEEGEANENDKWKNCSSTSKETLMTFAASCLGPIGGMVQKVIFLNLLHDAFNIGAAVCFFFVLAIYDAVVFYDKRHNEEKEEPPGKVFLFQQLIVYTISLLFIAAICRPEKEVSIGLHEPTGDCTTMIVSKGLTRKSRARRKYLCADEVADRKNYIYNFACVPNGPPCLDAIWYTICGSKISNRSEFFVLNLCCCVFFTSFLINVMFEEYVKEIQRESVEVTAGTASVESAEGEANAEVVEEDEEKRPEETPAE